MSEQTGHIYCPECAGDEAELGGHASDCSRSPRVLSRYIDPAITTLQAEVESLPTPC